MAPAKVCVVCGIDVSSVKRVKDPHGNYYCQVCYDAKLADRRARPSGDTEIDFQCQTCQRFFAVEDVYDEGGTIICKACFAARTRPAKKPAPVAAASQAEAPPYSPPAATASAAPAVPLEDIPMAQPIDETPAPVHESAPAYAVPVEVAAPVPPMEQLDVAPEEPAATATEWHVHDRGQSHGPMSEAELIAGCTEGRFSTAAQIWKEGMDGWQPIFRIESLLGHAV